MGPGRRRVGSEDLARPPRRTGFVQAPGGVFDGEATVSRIELARHLGRLAAWVQTQCETRLTSRHSDLARTLKTVEEWMADLESKLAGVGP